MHHIGMLKILARLTRYNVGIDYILSGFGVLQGNHKNQISGKRAGAECLI